MATEVMVRHTAAAASYAAYKLGGDDPGERRRRERREDTEEGAHRHREHGVREQGVAEHGQRDPDRSQVDLDGLHLGGGLADLALVRRPVVGGPVGRGDTVHRVVQVLDRLLQRLAAARHCWPALSTLAAADPSNLELETDHDRRLEHQPGDLCLGGGGRHHRVGGVENAHDMPFRIPRSPVSDLLDGAVVLTGLPVLRPGVELSGETRGDLPLVCLQRLERELQSPRVRHGRGGTGDAEVAAFEVDGVQKCPCLLKLGRDGVPQLIRVLLDTRGVDLDLCRTRPSPFMTF